MATNNHDKLMPKTMDISHPGKSMPNATSRPTIIGHRALIKDPMVVTGSKEETAPDDKIAPIKLTGRKITPPNDESAGDDNKDKAPDKEAVVVTVDAPEETDNKVSDDASADTTEETLVDDKEPAATIEKSQEAAAAEVADGDAKEPSDAPATKLDQQKIDEKKLQEELAKQEAIEKLVTDKTYYVPIGQKTRKRSMRHALIWIIIMLVVGVILADVLIDAGIVKNSIKAPVSLFKTNN